MRHRREYRYPLGSSDDFFPAEDPKCSGRTPLYSQEAARPVVVPLKFPLSQIPFEMRVRDHYHVSTTYTSI